MTIAMASPKLQVSEQDYQTKTFDGRMSPKVASQILYQSTEMMTLSSPQSKGKSHRYSQEFNQSHRNRKSNEGLYHPVLAATVSPREPF